MTKEKLINLAERAGWTFLQAFVAILLVTPEPFTKIGLAAAVAGGISALKTFLMDYLNSEKF